MSHEPSVPFAGGCACGAVRYECSASPLKMLNCHCRDCQLASGGAYSPTVIVAREALKLNRGSTIVFEKVAESGNKASREFCGSCGTPLFAWSSGGKAFVGIKAASLDDPSWFEAEMDVWVESAQPWDWLNPALPKFMKTRRHLQGNGDA